MPRTYKPRFKFPEGDRALVDKWITSYPKKSTQNAYYFGLANFSSWYKKPLAQFLKLPKHKRMQVALAYQSSAVQKRRANTVLTAVRALSSFLYYHKGETFNLRRQRLKTEMDVTSHIFSNSDLKTLFHFGSVEQKALIATFSSLGWEFSAVLGLDRRQVEALIQRAKDNGEKFVYLNGQRTKTGVPRYACLNPIAVEYLQKWFNIWKGPTVFKVTTKGGLNDTLKRLALKSSLVTTGSVHSHLFRKWVMDQLSRAGWNAYQIHLYVGKAIPSEDQTYLRTLEEQIREKYPKAFEEYLNINPARIVTVVDQNLIQQVHNKDAEIEELKVHAVAAEEKQKSEMEEIRREISTLKSMLVGAGPSLRFRTVEQLESIITSQKQLIEKFRKHGLVTTIDAKKTIKQKQGHGP